MLESDKAYIESIIPKKQLEVFRILTEDGKREIHIVDPIGKPTPFGKLTTINSWLRNINYTIDTINLSIINALDYCTKIKDDSLFNHKDENRFLANYFLENAIFRIIVMWDLFAQLCVSFYDLPCSPDVLHFNRLFKNFEDGDKYPEFEKLRGRVFDYISEKEGELNEIGNKPPHEWKGNHKYVRDIRNSFAHKDGPFHWSTINNRLKKPMKLAEYAGYSIHRIVADYDKCYSFINELHSDIKKWLIDMLEKID